MSSRAGIAIVTDSAAGLPAALIEQYNIHVIPYQLIWDGQVYLDGQGLTATEFYRRFRESPTHPTTSQPAPGSFIELYRRLAAKAEGIISIHVPETLSSTVRVARLAAQEVDQVPIEVVDARTAATPEGFIVLAAARAARRGATLRQVVSIAEACRERVGMYFTLETLEHLNRGGRIGQAAALLGSRLRIQPVLTLINGQVRPITVTRSRRQAKERVLDELARQVGDRPIRASVMHGDVAAEAEEMAEQVRERFCCIEFFATEFTPVMGAHTGPGIIGVTYCLEDEGTAPEEV